MAPVLEAPNPVATSTPTSALPSPAAPNTADTATLAPSPVATAKPTVKHEPEDGRMLAVPAAEEVVILEVEKKWLYCVTCHSPLKPPIFLCEVGHAVCCDCAGRGGERKHCGACNRAATYSHAPWMDGMVTGHKEPCPYKSFGCARSIVYYAAADHKARCAHAPCYCLECAFEGSPASLVCHLTDQSGRHRWPVEEIKGNASGGTTRPLYTGVLWVEGPLAASGHLRGRFKLIGELANCGVPGEVDMDHGQLHAHVNPEMLHGESKEVHLAICITKF
ncbi:E3 ubiquitin-protein ligase DIS1-like [Lolium rigidum]|uniref:E3 ubiquitin-protein ligase DIS1-like n=1 Tax=Lolium rigidum TaxID=89674 RepID=UPI001F5C3CC0|nr:E3 ubiquitin-protein ligase DIS1-like [Lolium rigidum]